MSLLLDLIKEDYTIKGRGQFLKTVEHDSLVIDTEKDIFFWNSKRISGDAYVWLTRIKGYTDKGAREYIKKHSSKAGLQIYTSITNERGETTTVYPKLVKLLWENGKGHRDYWYKRGVNDSTCDRFQLGYFEGWYTIPIFLDGALVNFQKRRDEPEKVILPWYRGVGPVLFNSDILSMSSAVIITESPSDVLLLSQYGYPAVSHTAGAGYWSPKWTKYFTEQKEIFITYDNDEAGRFGARRVAEYLGEYRSRVFTFDSFADKYDTGDWFLEHDEPQEFGKLIDAEAKRIFE
jgi:DNA primase